MTSERGKKITLNIIGVLFITWGIAAIINTLYRDDLAPILWLCYIGIILLGIGALKKDSFLITSQINILAVPLIFWTIDFFSFLINGKTLFGIVDYYFIPGPVIGKIISSQHLFTIPLSFYAIYLIKLKRTDAWKISFIQLILIFLATRIFTDPGENVNCVFSSCLNFTVSYYPLMWFVSTFLMVLLINFLIIKMKFFIINSPSIVNTGNGENAIY